MNEKVFDVTVDTTPCRVIVSGSSGVVEGELIAGGGAASDALESFLLALACRGVDIGSELFRGALQTCVDSVLENEALEVCRTCGDAYEAAGDGWDAECPTCADRSAITE